MMTTMMITAITEALPAAETAAVETAERHPAGQAEALQAEAETAEQAEAHMEEMTMTLPEAVTHIYRMIMILRHRAITIRQAQMNGRSLLDNNIEK